MVDGRSRWTLRRRWASLRVTLFRHAARFRIVEHDAVEGQLAAMLGQGASPHTVVIGCGALGRELTGLVRSMPGLVLTCLPARLHNRPERIPGAVIDRIAEVRAAYGEDVRVFVAYADCGTGGALDAALEGTGIERLPGAHCYEIYAGSAAFSALSDEEPGTFYLTDFLARQFDTLVWSGLGLDRHPGLLPQLFGNYRRLVYLAQTDDPDLDDRARSAAGRLGVRYERRLVGLGELAPGIVSLVTPAAAPIEEVA